jgi:hypothetical protein
MFSLIPDTQFTKQDLTPFPQIFDTAFSLFF